MKRKMQVKTMAIVLAATTTLQITGIASSIINGEAFVTAHAESNVSIQKNTQTIISNALVTGPGLSEGSQHIGYVVAKVPREIKSSSITTEEDFQLTGEIKKFPVTLTLSVQKDDGQIVEATKEVNVVYTNESFDGEVLLGNNALGAIDVYNIFESNYQDGIDVYNLKASFTTIEGVDYSVSHFSYSQSNNTPLLPFIVLIMEDVPTSIEITKDDNILRADLKDDNGEKYTTSAAVTYSWYRDNQLIDGESGATYELTDEDKGANIKVTAEEYGLVSEEIYIKDDSTNNNITTPASVRILGTRVVGNTLEAEFLTSSGAEITTSAGATYEWHRISNIDSDDEGELIGSNKTYILISNDQDKYIKLIASYGGKTFEKYTSRILRKPTSSSGSSSSSSSSSHSSQSDNAVSNQQTLNNETTKIKDGWEKQINGTWRYIENGHPVTGWKQINNIWYFMNSNGVMQTGWQQLNSNWYYLKEDGVMLSGWQRWNGNWYYLKSDGTMATGWQKWNNNWYYLYSDGSMATNTTIDGYSISSSGVMV